MAVATTDDLSNFTVDRLKTHAGTSPLFSTRVVKTGDALPGAYPYAIVRKGKDHGVPVVSGASLAQADVKVEVWSDVETNMPVCTVAAQAALNGWVQDPGVGPIRGVVLTDTGRTNVEDGKYTRTDTFGIFYDSTAEMPV